MSDILPSCMMPDGGEACPGYYQKCLEIERLQAEVARLQKKSELHKQAADRWLPCPDHRDKRELVDGCTVSLAECHSFTNSPYLYADSAVKTVVLQPVPLLFRWGHLFYRLAARSRDSRINNTGSFLPNGPSFYSVSHGCSLRASLRCNCSSVSRSIWACVKIGNPLLVHQDGVCIIKSASHCW